MTRMLDKKLGSLPVEPRATILFGFAVVALGVGAFVFWAMLAPLAEAVIAGGTVKVDSSRKLVQHLDGGIVKEILVRDGDAVKKNDALIRLDETRAAASVAILSDGYANALALAARLVAERDSLDEIVFPDALVDKAGDVKVQGILQSQVSLWKARRSALEGEVQILEKQVLQLREDIGGYGGQINAKTRQLGFVRDELNSMRELQKKGMVGKQRVLELEREAAEIEGDREELKSRVSAAKTEITRKELEIFQVGKGFRKEVVDELKKVETEINDLWERVNAAEHLLSQTEIRAPVDGIVVDIGVHTIGGVVPPGGTLLELVPVNDKLVVEARINPQDIDKVEMGLPASVKLPAFNQRTTPELTGVLRYVSADALEDPQKKVVYYAARVEVGEEEVKRLGDKRLQPGMVAEVFIRTGERTVADYLLQPVKDSFRRAWLED